MPPSAGAGAPARGAARDRIRGGQRGAARHNVVSGRRERAEPLAGAKRRLRFSASIGIAFSPQDANTAEDFIKKADQAMYTAKSAGRNQFSFFSPTTE
ncbi:diguanylate cyclase [uncultured Lamprocystis sp.]|uniref:diguanylate cyclase domain-containing protein n=1 Tax=uncultured Lamprocystis sp. TaxID=543132 RepID=UPI003439CE92